MMIREPIVAGQFYPASADRCRKDLLAVLETTGEAEGLPAGILAGIVPHAGWMCSGRVAAQVFKAIAMRARPETVILLGAVHRWMGKKAAMFGAGRWETPLGPVDVDFRLAERLLGHTNLVVDDPYAHEEEHSPEVQMPFVKHLFPGSKVLPIMVGVGPMAAEVGKAVARTLQAYKVPAVVVGTSDLTHYGSAYQFTPHGSGEEGRRWAKEVNDVRMIELMVRMDAERVVEEASQHRNACGAGAVAATLAAAAAQGADVTRVLEHTTSHEVLGGGGNDPAVGYVGVVYGRN